MQNSLFRKNTESQDRTELLRQVKDEVVNLKTSPLYNFRVQHNYHPVIGEGSHYAKIMFIGEGPGQNEAEQGRPFCGAAGKFLDELMLHIGMKRQDVYITNILKDRPPNNRDPQKEEIEAYAPFLDRQMEIIQPEVIVALGRYAMAYLMKKLGLQDQLKTISQIHGQVFTTKVAWGEIKFIPFYHPASALYNPNSKEILKNDFEILKQFLENE